MSHATARALSVASIHLGPINESRRRAGLTPLSAGEVEREFADVDRSPIRTKSLQRTTSRDCAADAMWGGIVGKLNASVPSSRAPIGARRASPVPASTRAVDWSEIAEAMNREAGLETPARRAR